MKRGRGWADSDGEGSDDGAAPGGSSRTTPSVQWQQVLEGLLDKTVMRAGYLTVVRGSCPFTREGLAEFYKVDRAAYDLLRESSGFDLCVDPTSPHTQLGGRAFCSRNCIQQMCHLEQHCGAQPGGKTAAIGHRPPPRNDPRAWARFEPEEQLHYVLLCKLKNQSELPPVQPRDRVESQQPQVQIAWPPLIMLKHLTDAEGDSAAKLKERFKNWTPSQCVPVYEPTFRGDAVLLFATPADEHYRAFEHACSLENEEPRARLVDWHTFQNWQRREPKWAKHLLKHAQFEPRLLANEKAKQNERVKKLAQVASEEKLKNAALAAENEKEVQRRQEIERSHGEQRKADEAQLREAKHQIELLNTSLKDSQRRYQEEQDRQRQAQEDMMREFGSAAFKEQMRHVQAVEAQRATEMKMRNTQMELAQFKSMMMQKDRQAQALLQAQAAEFEREKAQAAAQAQTAAQAEERRAHEARRAEILQVLKVQMDEEKHKFELKLQEKEEEVRQARQEAESIEAGRPDESTYMHQVSQVQAFKTAFKPIDELFKKQGWVEKISASGRFGWRQMGDLSHQKLRALGMTAIPTPQLMMKGRASMAQIALFNEVSNWQAVIEGAEKLPYSPEAESPENRPTPGAPPFSYKDAFYFLGGSYTAICEHDIPAQEQKPNVIRDGKGEVINAFPRPPIPGHDASFVRSIRDRYKTKADGILHYLREQVNEYQSCDVSTGYSAAKVAWDLEKDEPMSHAQKVAFLLEQAAQLDSAFDGVMRSEVPGFTPADLATRRSAPS